MLVVEVVVVVRLWSWRVLTWRVSFEMPPPAKSGASASLDLPTDLSALTREEADLPRDLSCCPSKGAPSLIHLSLTLQSMPADRTRPVNAASATDVDDLTVLRNLDEPNILDTLRRRFERDKIYTYTGPILIVLNPWKSISGLYDSSTMQAYQRESSASLAHLPPHAFAVACKAFECVRRTGKNQAILVSGESGAGKWSGVCVCGFF